MPVRLSAVIRTPPFEEALRLALREQANLDTTIGALIAIDKTGVDGDASVSERLPPASSGSSWDCVEPTPAAIHDAGFTPRGIGHLLAGHLRHGRQPWALADIRSRPPSARRHHKAR